MKNFICEACGKEIEDVNELHHCYCGFYCHKKHLQKLIRISFFLEGDELYKLQEEIHKKNEEIEFENVFDN